MQTRGAVQGRNNLSGQQHSHPFALDGARSGTVPKIELTNAGVLIPQAPPSRASLLAMAPDQSADLIESYWKCIVALQGARQTKDAEHLVSPYTPSGTPKFVAAARGQGPRVAIHIGHTTNNSQPSQPSPPSQAVGAGGAAPDSSPVGPLSTAPTQAELSLPGTPLGSETSANENS
jgi:hypothetical protein